MTGFNSKFLGGQILAREMARVVHWFPSRTDGTLPNNLGCKNQKRAQGQLLITSRLNFDLQRQQVSLHLHGR